MKREREKRWLKKRGPADRDHEPRSCRSSHYSTKLVYKDMQREEVVVVVVVGEHNGGPDDWGRHKERG